MRRGKGGGAVWIVALAILALILAMQLLAGEATGYRRFLRPLCEWCARPGTWRDALSVHHNLTQVRHPELANVETNCVTLHMTCQRVLGHWTNTRLENPRCIDLVREYGRAPWRDGKQEISNVGSQISEQGKERGK